MPVVGEVETCEEREERRARELEGRLEEEWGGWYANGGSRYSLSCRSGKEKRRKDISLDV